MRLPVRHFVHGLLFSVVLLLQAPGIGIARAVPEKTESVAPETPVAERNGGPRRDHPPPEPAAPGEVSAVRFDDRQQSTIPGSIRTLRRVQRMLAAHPELRLLRVEGHADDSGDPCFNLEVSKRRARGVVRWLLANGVAAERLEVVACGHRYVDASQRGPAARSRNRRVELAVSEPTQGLVLRDRCDPIELR